MNVFNPQICFAVGLERSQIQESESEVGVEKVGKAESELGFGGE